MSKSAELCNKIYVCQISYSIDIRTYNKISFALVQNLKHDNKQVTISENLHLEASVFTDSLNTLISLALLIRVTVTSCLVLVASPLNV